MLRFGMRFQKKLAVRIFAVAVLTIASISPFQNCSSGFQSLESSKVATTTTRVDPVPNPEILKPLDEAGYDIIITAGQSNSTMAGQGSFQDPVGSGYDAQIFQIGREPQVNLKVIPAGDAIQAWGYAPSLEGKRAAFVMSFARQYAKERLSSKRKVLIVAGGYGGTSLLFWDDKVEFTGDNTILADDLKARVAAALRQPGQNRVVAFLWHQGETDVGVAYHLRNNLSTFSVPYPGGSAEVPTSLGGFSQHAQRLANLIAKVRLELDEPHLPFIKGELSERHFRDLGSVTVGSGANAKTFNYADQYLMLNDFYEAHRQLEPMIGDTGFASSQGLPSNGDAGFAECSGSGLEPVAKCHVHFSAQGQIEFGKRYFNKWRDIKKVFGNVESATRETDGTVTVVGWTCERGSTQKEIVHAIASPTGATEPTPVASAYVDAANEPEVSSLCGTAGPHRFKILIPAHLAKSLSGQKIEVQLVLNDRSKVIVPGLPLYYP